MAETNPPASLADSDEEPAKYLSPAEGLGFFRRLDRHDYVAGGTTARASPNWIRAVIIGLICLLGLMLMMSRFSIIPDTLRPVLTGLVVVVALAWAGRAVYRFLKELLELVH